MGPSNPHQLLRKAINSAIHLKRFELLDRSDVCLFWGMSWPRIKRCPPGVHLGKDGVEVGALDEVQGDCWEQSFSLLHVTGIGGGITLSTVGALLRLRVALWDAHVTAAGETR